MTIRIPRDVSARDLLAALRSAYGYEVSRQAGSHIRVTTSQAGQHHVTVPNHDPIRLGTLAGIVSDVGRHHSVSRDEVVKKLFG